MKTDKHLKDFQKILYELTNTKKAPFIEQKSYFSASFPTSKALRIILLKFYMNILYYRDQLLKREREEDLHQFRVNLRRSRAFIKTFPHIFKDDVDTLLLKQLGKIATYTNHKRDLDVMNETLHTMLQNENKLFEEIQARSHQEQKKITKMLEDDTLKDFLNYYEKVLVYGDHLFISPNKDVKIHKGAKEVIDILEKRIQKRIKALKKEFSVTKLHKIRIAFKKLRYLLEEFKHLFDDKSVTKHIEQVKDLQTILGDFNDAINQKALISQHMERGKTKSSLEEIMKHTCNTEENLTNKVLEALDRYRRNKFKLN
jgi:CHAD domain-containing protein